MHIKYYGYYGPIVCTPIKYPSHPACAYSATSAGLDLISVLCRLPLGICQLSFPDSLPVFTNEIHVAVSGRRQLIIFMACESNLIKSVFLSISSDSETVKLPYEVSQVHFE